MTGLVLPDANVLFSRTLRDWLFLLAHRGRLYTVHSTEDILAETMAKYRDRHPMATGQRVEILYRQLRANLHSGEILGPPARGARRAHASA